MQTEKSGPKATLFLPSGEKYCGSWQHNKREGKRIIDACCYATVTVNRAATKQHVAGTGTVVYANKDKYEGDWLNGKRHGVGALWLYDSDRYRIRYTGEWRKDKFHVRFIL